jgi:hypothetical protein
MEFPAAAIHGTTQLYKHSIGLVLWREKDRI